MSFRKAPLLLAAVCSWITLPALAEPHSTPWDKKCANVGKSRCVVVARYSSEDPYEDNWEVHAGLISTPGAADNFRVLLPLRVQIKYGTRIVIDDGKPIQASLHHCSTKGCSGNFVRRDTLDAIRGATKLEIQFVHALGHIAKATLPMSEFRAAAEKQILPLLQRDRGNPDDNVAYAEFLSDMPPDVTLPDTVSTLSPGEWQKRCDSKGCDVRMTIMWQDGKNSMGARVIQVDENGSKKYVVEISTPLSFYLRKRPELSFDSFSPIATDFTLCNKSCVIEFKLDESSFNVMRTNKKFSILATTVQGNAWYMNFPLAGFADVYDGPGKTLAQIEREDQKRSTSIRRLGHRFPRSNLPTTTLHVIRGSPPEF